VKTDLNSLGKRIKELRKDQGLTQTEFGEKIGVKGNTVTGYENGTRRPSDSVINYICLIFDVNQTWIRTGEGEMYIPISVTLEPLENLFFEKGCNNLEIRFLEAYFGLKPKERKAFCELLVKMFPGAIKEMVGSEPLICPFEAPPLPESKNSDAKNVNSVEAAEAAYEKNLGIAQNTGLSASNTTGGAETGESKKMA